MNRYTAPFKKLGEGTFGDVFLVELKETGEKCAIKRIKVTPGRYDFNTFLSLKEIHVLKAIPHHPNVIKIFDAMMTTNAEYYLAFEYADQGSIGDCLATVRHNASVNQPLLPDGRIKSILRDAMQGLQHIHQHGFFHRDIKPENLLLRNGVCKIADFSVARRVPQAAAHTTDMTSYVSTRWYRAPEILLRAPIYGAPVDIYALGCVAAEMYHPFGEPLFAAASEVGQLYKIFSILGVPTQESWPEGVQLMQHLGVACPPMQDRRPLESRLAPYLTETSRDWLRNILALYPGRRFTATEALNHNFVLHDSPGVQLFPVVSSASLATIHSATQEEMTSPPPTKKSRVMRNPYKKKYP